MNKKLKKSLWLVLMAALIGAAVLAIDWPRTTNAVSSVYDRVMATKTIRCGYMIYDPYLTKDMKTNKIGGLTVDYVNAVAAREGLTVEWTTDINVDQIIMNLDYDRIDAFCVPTTPDDNWAQMAEFVADLGAWPYYTYVRSDSSLTREQLNTARFVMVDGYNQTVTTTEHYPKAKFVNLPQTVSAAEMYDQLKFGKADAFVNEPISAALYAKANPGTIKKFSDEVLSAQRMFFMSKKGDQPMADFLEKTFDADRPENGALLRELIKRYDLPPGSMLIGDECRPFDTNLGWKMCQVQGKS